MSERIYTGGTISAQELRDEVAAFWRELPENDELRREVEELDISPAEVERIDPASDVDVRQGEGEPFGPAIPLIIAFAPAVVHILDSLWDEVVVPWIQSRRGDDALGQGERRR